MTDEQDATIDAIYEQIARRLAEITRGLSCIIKGVENGTIDATDAIARLESLLPDEH